MREREDQVREKCVCERERIRLERNVCVRGRGDQVRENCVCV